MSMSLTVLGVNVRGIRQFKKRRDVFQYIKGLRCALYCLVDTHITPDMKDRIRSEWGTDVFMSCGSGNSRGIVVLPSPGAPVIVHNFVSDDLGNYIIMNVEFDGYFKCTLVVLYGPNDDDPAFFVDLFDRIFNSGVEQLPVIFVGDWNLVMNEEKDTKFYRQIGNPRARRVVLDVIEQENLIDVWREQHLNLLRYTWRKQTPAKYSRLDFFLVSPELLSYIKSSDISYGYRTDHNAVTITFKNPQVDKRTLFWKFNNSLLKDDKFVNLVKTEILHIKRFYSLPPYSMEAIQMDPDIQFTVNDQLFFETLLCHLRGICIQYAARKKRTANLEEKRIVNTLQNLMSVATSDSRVNEEEESLRNELYLIREKKVEGMLLRAKAKWIELGERPTRYFCSLEKRQYARKYIGSLNINGHETHDQNVIINHLKHFFEKVFRSRGRSKKLSDIRHRLGDNVPRLSTDERMEIEGMLSVQEASSAVAKLHNDKSPGPDGFTSNFFKFFFLERFRDILS